MRIFSYLYHLVLGLFLFLIGGLALFGSGTTLSLEMLPWEEPTLTYLVFLGGLLALISLILAVTGKFRLLFRLWTVIVFALMVYSYFFSGYGFRFDGEFSRALLLTLGALIALLGSMTSPRRRRA